MNAQVMSEDSVNAELRQTGKAHEVAFWSQFMRSDRFLINWCDAAPNPELELEIDVVVKSLALSANAQGKTFDVLDVGSGASSILSHSFVGLDVRLMAADPLADDYDALWVDQVRRLKVCRPTFCLGEGLVAHFGRRTFDLAHIRNALDHSENPVTVVQQLIEVTKRSGFVIIHGFENEAITENWQGFHQWNIQFEERDLVITGRSGRPHRLMETFARKTRLVRTWRKQILPDKFWCGIMMQVI